MLPLEMDFSPATPQLDIQAKPLVSFLFAFLAFVFHYHPPFYTAAFLKPSLLWSPHRGLCTSKYTPRHIPSPMPMCSGLL